MEQNRNNTSSFGLLSGDTIDVIFKFICAILGISALVMGLYTKTWHNVAFAFMFYGIYKAIKHEEG